MCRHTYKPSMVLVNQPVAARKDWQHIPVKDLPPETLLFTGGNARMRPCLKCTKCGRSIAA